MIVEEDRGVGHGGEPDSGDPDLAQISTLSIFMKSLFSNMKVLSGMLSHFLDSNLSPTDKTISF